MAVGFKQKSKITGKIPNASLADIVFLLLIFFMVSTQFISFTRRLDIKIPEAKAGKVEEKKTKEIPIQVS